MAHVITSVGFEIDVDPIVFDDMELVDSIAEVTKGHTIELPTVANKLLGERKKELYDLLRTEDGRVPTSAVLSQITEIVNGAKAKNS